MILKLRFEVRPKQFSVIIIKIFKTNQKLFNERMKDLIESLDTDDTNKISIALDKADEVLMISKKNVTKIIIILKEYLGGL